MEEETPRKGKTGRKEQIPKGPGGQAKFFRFYPVTMKSHWRSRSYRPQPPWRLRTPSSQPLNPRPLGGHGSQKPLPTAMQKGLLFQEPDI